MNRYLRILNDASKKMLYLDPNEISILVNAYNHVFEHDYMIDNDLIESYQNNLECLDEYNINDYIDKNILLKDYSDAFDLYPEKVKKVTLNRLNS